MGPPGSTELLLVRHGASADAVEGEAFELVEGQGDPPLSQVGRHQAELVARRLVAEPFDGMYVSTLRRTAETAAPLVERTGMHPVVDADLREIFLGEWEGGHLRQKAADGDPTFEQVLREQRWDVIPGAESRGGVRRPPAARHRAHRQKPPRGAGHRLQPRRRHRGDPRPGQPTRHPSRSSTRTTRRSHGSS